MDISCDIIRDLLPLYAENLVSEDSRKLVDEHLCTCDPCTKQLGILKKTAALPIEVETKTLKRVEDTIRRRRILAVLTAVMVVATLILSVTLLLDARIYLSADQAIVSVEALEDGSLRIRTADIVSGTGSLGDGNPHSDELSGNYGIIMSARLGSLLNPPKRQDYNDLPEELRSQIDPENWGAKIYQLPGGASSQNFWYCNPWTGKGASLLWDAGNHYNGEALGDVNFHLAYYFYILIGVCVILCLIAHCCEKNWIGEIFARLAIFAGCNAVSLLIVTAGQFMEIWGEFTSGMVNGLVLSVPMTLTVVMARQLRRLNRQDRGME